VVPKISSRACRMPGHAVVPVFQLVWTTGASWNTGSTAGCGTWPHLGQLGSTVLSIAVVYCCRVGGSVAEWMACWTQAQKGPGSNRSRDTLSGNSLRQTVHTHRASVHQAAKLVAALLRVA